MTTDRSEPDDLDAALRDLRRAIGAAKWTRYDFAGVFVMGVALAAYDGWGVWAPIYGAILAGLAAVTARVISWACRQADR